MIEEKTELHNGWRPIETAPKDGTPILGGRSPHRNRMPVYVCLWSETYGTFVSNLPEVFVRAQSARIDRAYNAGEPVWMIADELRMVFETQPIHRPTKTPRALALRSVKVGV